jgi:hypothetical protein
MAAQVIKRVQPVVAANDQDALSGDVHNVVCAAVSRSAPNVDPFAREDPIALASIKLRREIACAI